LRIRRYGNWRGGPGFRTEQPPVTSRRPIAGGIREELEPAALFVGFRPLGQGGGDVFAKRIVEMLYVKTGFALEEFPQGGREFYLIGSARVDAHQVKAYVIFLEDQGSHRQIDGLAPVGAGDRDWLRHGELEGFFACTHAGDVCAERGGVALQEMQEFVEYDLEGGRVCFACWHGLES
jgi:hypothetical protein